MKFFPYLLSILLLIVLILPAQKSWAQSQEQEPDYSEYYYHKKSLFEALPNAENEIIWLGDSITDGNQWAELFGNPKMKNRGISGDITDGVLYRLDEVTESTPAKIFIMIGVNDFARDRSVDYVLSNYRKIVDRIQEASPQTDIYIQSILPVNDEFPQFPSHTDETPDILEANRKLQKLAEEKESVYIDLFDDMSAEDNKLNPDYTEDGLHLNGKGYLVWKSAVEQYLD